MTGLLSVEPIYFLVATVVNAIDWTDRFSGAGIDDMD
jgi:hypothetical protein